MRATVIYGAGDIRVEDRPDPSILEPSDAVVRTVAACVCGSDLWRYRGIAAVPEPTPIGHEYVGIVEAVGDEVTTIRPGQFVVGGFLHSDNTCPLCRKGMHASSQHGGGFDGCQAELIRIPNADGTLLATPAQPDPDLIIRTSGEQRLSGFLLWQSAHSEFYFCDAYWPEFRRVDWLRALRAYAARTRRYGT